MVAAMTPATPKSLYVHVPFCVRKCAYCDFYSVPAGDGADITRYLEALRLEALAAPPMAALSTLYIGGGTPNVLPAAVLRGLIQLLHRRFELATLEEFTTEANPGSLAAEVLDVLLAGGLTRLSLGVQSLNPATLAALGRVQDASAAPDAVALARRHGVPNLSLDLIFAVPGQTLDDWLADLRAAVELAPDHLSVYGLSIGASTPLGRRVAAGQVVAPDDELYVDMFEAAHAALAGAGYEHYEISNYARPGRRCRHNMATWHNEPYLGLGPAACSYVAGRRWTNVADVDAYADRLARGESPVGFAESLGPERRARETAVLGLRTSDGLDVLAFRRTTGFDPLRLFAEAIASHAAEGFLEVDASRGGTIRLTARGLPVADSILADFVC